MSSNLKPTAATLDVPLGEERKRAITLLGDRWALWTILAIDERHGARFTDLAGEPGLSRRVLAERLRELTHAGLVEARQYQARPPRSRYVLTERGHQVRRLALALVHVAAGGALAADPLVDPGSPAAGVTGTPGSTASREIDHEDGIHAPIGSAHPADELLAADPAAAVRIHESTIAPLERYDERYSTSLVATLETWLACDASVSVTAARMYAHRHTIRYRLDRIRELTHLDPATTQDREQLVLGLRARRFLGAR